MTDTLTHIADALDATIARLGTELRAAQAARDALSTALNGGAPSIIPEQIEQAREAATELDQLDKWFDETTVPPAPERAARQSRMAIHEAVRTALRMLHKKHGDEVSVADIAGCASHEYGSEIDTRTASQSLAYGSRHGWAQPGKRGMWSYDEFADKDAAASAAAYKPTDDEGEDGATDEGSSSVEQG